MNSQEFTHLPPWKANQQLPDEEILDIILFGIPKSWEKEMDRQGFDPLDQSLANVVAKLEDIESAEVFLTFDSKIYFKEFSIRTTTVTHWCVNVHSVRSIKMWRSALIRALEQSFNP